MSKELVDPTEALRLLRGEMELLEISLALLFPGLAFLDFVLHNP